MVVFSFSPFRESEFTIESTSESVNDGRMVYFSKQALEYLYNVYLFDEFENCINQLKVFSIFFNFWMANGSKC